MSTNHHSPGLDNKSARDLMHNPNAAAELPDGEFQMSDLPIPARNLMLSLVGTEAVEIVGREDMANVYRLTELGIERRDEVIGAGYRPLPCGHTGLENIDGQTFACGYDKCDQQYGLSEVGE